MDKLKNKVGGAMASVYSRVTGTSGRRERADRLRKLIKEARGYDNAPNQNDDGTLSDAYKTRFMKKALVGDYMAKVKKGKSI